MVRSARPGRAFAELSNPAVERHYEHLVWDSGRWAGFRPRPDDILICTSYKAGTTWTQMICALLIFRTQEFGQPLTGMSPWLDLKAAPIEETLAIYDAQTHRRFIKTHTPLDGLPYWSDVTYLTVGRDPRDVFMSMLNQLKNNDPQASERFFGEVPAAELPDDPNELFRIWLSTGSFDWETDGFPYWSHFRHAASFWKYRHLSNIHFFHYNDLKADLVSEMTAIAAALGIDVEPFELRALARSAGFQAMKSRADELAPDVNFGMWRDNQRFFNRGENRQWEGVLDAESLALYEAKKREQPAGLGQWLEEGSRSVGNPRDL
jgi:aryl sulfotransferase